MPARIIVLIYLLFTYSGGLWALLGSMLIVLVAWLAWRRRWVEHFGLSVSPTQALLALLALSFSAVAAWILIPSACQAQGIHLTPIWQRDGWIILALHTLGQTFNEEIVLGWMLLTTLRRRVPGLTLPALSLTVALIFAVLHYVFYAARPAAYLNFGLLSATALLAVFAAGALRNNLILGIGNISLAWGVHLGWNLIFIDSAYTWSATGGMLSEPAIFNAVFGYLPIMIWLTVLMGVSLLPYIKLGARR
jgi:hypothetical protein